MMVYVLAAAESLAGLFILARKLMNNDLLTKTSGGIIAFVMLGAIKMVHWEQWGFMASKSHPAGGMEFQFTLMCIGLYFLIRGND